jgi:copper chaperone CopZ
MKKDKKLIGAGLLTAIASSLCCITPVLALILGTSGIASTFSWLEPFRPYLIGFTILVLGFAWYQKLKPKKEIDCDCETDEKLSFIQSKLFLGIVTLFAIVMTAFPYYSSVFYPKSEKEIIIVDKANIQTVNLEIKGMTCVSCEEHINHSVNQLNGILNVKSSYENKNTEIEFDNSKTTIEEIKKAVNTTGYTVINIKEK